MAERRINGGVIASAALHAVVLAFALFSLPSNPLTAPVTDVVYVDTITPSELSQMTAGVKTAEKKETPKPLVEKKAPPRPVENVAAQISEQPEIVTDSAPPPPPPPQEVKVPTPTPKPPPKEAKAAPPETKEPDELALKKKEPKEVKKQPPKEAKPTPAPKKPPPEKKVVEKKPERQVQEWKADQIASLLDKRAPRRQAAAGEEPNTTPSLGTPRGQSSQLTQNEIDALVAKLRQCWQTLGGDLREDNMKIPITLRFRPDGSLASAPQIDMPLRTPRERAMADGIVRAVMNCQPYTMLPRAKYDEWKELGFNFDPKTL
jgi:hypothetical protein